MGSCTIMLGFQLRSGVKHRDVTPIVRDLLCLVMDDVTILYPSNGDASGDGPVLASGNKGKSEATLRHHSNGLLTLDVQHECRSEAELLPLAEPYTLDYIRRLEKHVEERLGDICEKSVSIYTPIRRACRLPRNYYALADDRLIETDYTHTLHDVISPFQRVTIMHSRQFGAVLMVDDDVMFGESDEIYVTTLLGLDRGNNFGGSNVLILGGGDGGVLYTLTSLAKPPKHVLMAEIDDEVMKACGKHMRSICGHVLDTYKTDNYEIAVRDCLEVLRESEEKGIQYDYVINDLTEFSVEKDKYGFTYDFKTNNIIMELSINCLKQGGKYLARGNSLSAAPYVEKIEKELTDLSLPFKRFDRLVPSFRETYCFFEAEKPHSK